MAKKVADMDMDDVINAVQSLPPLAIIRRVLKDVKTSKYILRVAELEWNPVDRWTVVKYNVYVDGLNISTGEETRESQSIFTETIGYFRTLAPEAWWVYLPEHTVMQFLVMYDPAITMGVEE